MTNSKGCRLSSRITREIVMRLPKGIGNAVDNVGRLRDKAKADQQMQRTELPPPNDEYQNLACEDDTLPSTPNEPVPQMASGNSAQNLDKPDETSLARIQRRMRWVAQVSEYWPLESLASLDDESIDGILSGTSQTIPKAIMTGGEPTQLAKDTIASAPTHHTILALAPEQPSDMARGRILLLGSGPGHPSLLTLATSSALRTADLVLSDKLVPEGVLRAIPKRERIIQFLEEIVILHQMSNCELPASFPGMQTEPKRS